MTILNRLYGILTNGDNSVRKTTGTRSGLPPLGKKIVSALVPDTLSDAGIRALAEIYIRLCQTSPELIELLQEKDPINSYSHHTFSENFSDSVELQTIVDRVRRIGLPEEENSFLPLDYIVNALRQLLNSLDAAH